jgi:hypothetical protein
MDRDLKLWDQLVYENVFLESDKYGSEVSLLIFQAFLDDEFNGTSYELRDHYLEFLTSEIGFFATVSLSGDSNEIVHAIQKEDDELPREDDNDDDSDFGMPNQLSMVKKFSKMNWLENNWTCDWMGRSMVYSAHLDALALEIRRSWQYKMLQELSVYRKSTGEKETDMLKRFLEVRNAGVVFICHGPIVRPMISTLICRFRG